MSNKNKSNARTNCEFLFAEDSNFAADEESKNYESLRESRLSEDVPQFSRMNSLSRAGMGMKKIWFWLQLLPARCRTRGEVRNETRISLAGCLPDGKTSPIWNVVPGVTPRRGVPSFNKDSIQVTIKRGGHFNNKMPGNKMIIYNPIIRLLLRHCEELLRGELRPFRGVDILGNDEYIIIQLTTQWSC